MTRARPQVCCTESDPAWLLVSLGAVRPVAAFQLTYRQDLTFTLALANSSAGPFVTVATQYCDACTMNFFMERWVQRTYAVTGAPVTASFARLRVTYSSAGGVGGCDGECPRNGYLACAERCAY